LSRRRRGGVSPVGIPKLPQEKKTQRNARKEEEEERIFERERENKRKMV